MKKKKSAAKKVLKAKAPVRRVSAKTESSQGSSDFSEFMSKVLSRLDSLEAKMDVLIQQSAEDTGAEERSSLREAEANLSYDSELEPLPLEKIEKEFYEETQVTENVPPKDTPQEIKPVGRRRGRPVYQAVCADCSVSCEIPFKPTGERPVYCGKCFAQRKKAKKDGGVKPPQTGVDSQPAQSSPVPAAQPSAVSQPRQPRIVKVIPNGVGRVTIREMVPAPAAATAVLPKPNPSAGQRPHKHFKGPRGRRFNRNR